MGKGCFGIAVRGRGAEGMTNEEAIRNLDAMWKMLTSAYDEMADSFVVAYTMAVDALKAKGTCEDAVSRQTLQEELALYPIDDVTTEDEAGYNRAINDVQKMVLHLPSVQPEKAQLSGENATFDCISRQTAIDALDKIFDNIPMEQTTEILTLRRALRELPSAQPVLDRTKISDLLEKIYSIQSPHLSTEGVIAKKYYCKQLWIELFGSEDMPAWID